MKVATLGEAAPRTSKPRARKAFFWNFQNFLYLSVLRASALAAAAPLLERRSPWMGPPLAWRIWMAPVMVGSMAIVVSSPPGLRKLMTASARVHSLCGRGPPAGAAAWAASTLAAASAPAAVGSQPGRSRSGVPSLLPARQD